MLFQMCTKLTFGLSYILVIAVIAQNRIKSVSVSCSFVIGPLGLTIKYAPKLKMFGVRDPFQKMKKTNLVCTSLQ